MGLSGDRGAPLGLAVKTLGVAVGTWGRRRRNASSPHAAARAWLGDSEPPSLRWRSRLRLPAHGHGVV